MQEQKLTEEQQKQMAEAVEKLQKHGLPSEEDQKKALEEIRARKDMYLGIPEDADDELRQAIRNMGPLTRKIFLKKLTNEERFRKGRRRKAMTEERYEQYVKHYANLNKESA